MDRSSYSSFVQSAPGSTLFHQPWWLDAVTGGNWKVASHQDNKGHQIALPIITTSALGKIYIISPPCLSPFVSPLTSKDINEIDLGMRHRLLNGLIEALPKFDYCNVSLAHQDLNALPWKWANWSIDVSYTYQLSIGTDRSTVFNSFDSKLRNSIRRAEKELIFEEATDATVLFDLTRKSFGKHGLKPPFTMDQLKLIFEACHRNGSGRILIARDSAKGFYTAAVFVAWHSDTAFYLVGGSDPEVRHEGANAALIWKQIEKLPSEISTFDFEGSSVKSIESFFRGFGANQQILLSASKTSTWFNLIQGIKRCVKKFIR